MPSFIKMSSNPVSQAFKDVLKSFQRFLKGFQSHPAISLFFPIGGEMTIFLCQKTFRATTLPIPSDLRLSSVFPVLLTYFRILSPNCNTVCQTTAIDFFYSQIFSGGAVDGYSGCPNIGKKRALEIIKIPVVWVVIEHTIKTGPNRALRSEAREGSALIKKVP